MIFLTWINDFLLQIRLFSALEGYWLAYRVRVKAIDFLSQRLALLVIKERSKLLRLFAGVATLC